MKRSVHLGFSKKHGLVLAMILITVSLQAQSSATPLLAMEARQQRLTWTADPALDDQFVVQRHEPGMGFTDIALVWTGAGFYTYQFTDKKPLQPACSYRLKRIGTNKIISYTEVDNGSELTSYPNPAHDQLVFTIPAEWTAKPVHVSVLKSDGTLAMQADLTGAPSITLNVERLLAGNYLVRLDCARDSKRQWIQKL
jgi:hypothetical protein